MLRKIFLAVLLILCIPQIVFAAYGSVWTWGNDNLPTKTSPFYLISDQGAYKYCFCKHTDCAVQHTSYSSYMYWRKDSVRYYYFVSPGDYVGFDWRYEEPSGDPETWDIDNDFTPDYLDEDPNDPTVPFSDPLADEDGDDIPNVEDPFPYDPNIPFNQCWETPSPDNDFDNDTIPDYLDDDIDGDDILNNEDNDNDNDGIPDWYDLAPYSADNPQWKVNTEYFNDGYSPGAFPDGGDVITKNGDAVSWGDTAGVPIHWVDVGAPSEWHEPDTFPYDLGGSGSQAGESPSVGSPAGGWSPSPAPVGPPVDDYGEPVIDVPPGDDNVGNTIDTDYLEDIVNNSQSNLVGIGIAVDYLSDIESDQTVFGRANLQELQNIGDKLSTGEVSAVDIGNAVESSQSLAGSTEAAAQSVYLDEVGSGTYDGFVDTDIPDTTESQTSYESAVSDISDNSDLASVKTQVGVELSGSVSSVSCQAFGSQIDFDFGKYDSIYNVMGVAWLSLCYLFGFFLIIRG